MRSVVYRLVYAGTGTAAGQAELLIPTKGKLYGVVWRFRGTAGAGNGFYSPELGLNQVANGYGETQYPVKTATIAACTYGAISGGMTAGTNAMIPVQVNLDPGDRLTINQIQIGTAFASHAIICDCYVQE